MKYYSQTVLFFSLLLLFGMSCTKDAPVNNNASINDIVKSGTWQISLYNDKGVVKTSNFAGYNFAFNSNGTVTATGASNVSGTWSVISDSGKQKFLLNFGSVSLFNELNEDWEVTSKTATEINLAHVSGGDGGTSQLTLKKR